jgi:hypothetical protein
VTPCRTDFAVAPACWPEAAFAIGETLKAVMRYPEDDVEPVGDRLWHLIRFALPLARCLTSLSLVDARPRRQLAGPLTAPGRRAWNTRPRVEPSTPAHGSPTVVGYSVASL